MRGARGFRVDVTYMKSRPAAWAPWQLASSIPTSRAASATEPEARLTLTRFTVQATADGPLHLPIVRVGRSDAPATSAARCARTTSRSSRMTTTET